jgi:16S rRNA processing protein rimM
MQKYFEVGQIVNTFGINGVVKVKPFTDEIERFEELKFVLIEKNNQLVKYEIKEVKYQKQMVLLKLNGIDNMNQAETFKGCYLKIERKYAKKLPEVTYFIADLIGLNVYTDEGKLLGRLEDIYNSGSSDIYVVKNELGKQILLPAIKDVIKQIDLNDEKIVVHLLKGLVED